MSEKKEKTDWEAIERAYRAGILSIREIAKLHKVSDTAIRKKAKAEGWERDLTAKVQEKVRSELVRSSVRTDDAQTKQTEREIVEGAAATVVEVVRSHRKDISTGRNIVGLLMEQLTDAALYRDKLEDIIEDETKVDEADEKKSVDSKLRRRAALMKAVSIPAHASTVRDLSTAMKNLVALERQAFNIADDSAPPPLSPETATDDELNSAIKAFAAEAGLSLTSKG